MGVACRRGRNCCGVPGERGGGVEDRGSYSAVAGMRLHLRMDRNRGWRRTRSPVPGFLS